MNNSISEFQDFGAGVKHGFCQLWLTVGGKEEAAKIAKVLLEKHLVACVHQLPVNSNFRWQAKIDSSQEVLLIMDSRQDLFDDVEREVAKLHSYGTFVLEATSINRVSKKAETWLQTELK